ncbi:NADH dehydrogenase [ubiquinone] 1 beta subcomplex subunit 10-like [Xenia sp. Carnegie-2017]|uniref:NADH dehydrogenase [ubiquinone] 1 beta subcomplex subunit 10-like n=1 Tax=Xenia sp. Carnegie-2017 TaxID=2897299 RepID=UPI001F03943C|nr:NADH dehydrogenase [ubiquinone] 1 beta subcomplex subunit 10-like [Xenia sp. Carnegie-2017]
MSKLDSFKRYYSERSPSFDEIDCMDPAAFYQAKRQWARDKAINAEKVKIYRERMRDCYQREEVNFQDNCKKEINDYWQAFQLFKKDDWGYTDGGNVNAYKQRHEKFIEKAVRELNS